MARVPYVQPDQVDGLLAEAYANTHRMNGNLPNFHRILGHVPLAYPWYQGLQFTLQRAAEGSSLPATLRQLAHLATSEANRCRYCAAHNAEYAAKLGFSAEQIGWLHESIDDDPDPALFDERERAVIRWARAVTRNQARRDTALFAELEDLFTPTEIVELTVVVAARTFTNLIQEALWTDLEDEVEGPEPDQERCRLPDDATPRELLAGHARTLVQHLEAQS
jgi:AhpD family alkylhydroperoxidase